MYIYKLQVKKIYSDVYKNTNIVYTYSKYIQYSDFNKSLIRL